MARTSDSPSWPIVELRQYTLHPGQRDVLVDLFEAAFIESHDALGMKIFGTYRDLDRPDRLVWIRGFQDMASRSAALEAFYSGPVWKAHRKAANATMIDSGNVLLLHTARAGSGLAPTHLRAPKGAAEVPRGLVVANIYYFAASVPTEFVAFFDRAVEPQLRGSGITVRGSYVTETSPNNFPALPVRENEHVFVWFSTFADLSDYEKCLARLARSEAWRTTGGELQARLKGKEVLRLQPTSRSAWPALD